MSLTAIVGIAVISAVFLFIAFKLDEEHGLLRFAFILFAMGLLFFIPASVLHSQTSCEPVISTTELVGNTTTYDYTTYCYEESGVGVGLVKAVKYPYWLFIAYMVVYLFYRSAVALGNAGNNGSLRRFFKGWKR